MGTACMCLSLWKRGSGCDWSFLQERHLDKAHSDVSLWGNQAPKYTNAGSAFEESWRSRTFFHFWCKSTLMHLLKHWENNQGFPSFVSLLFCLRFQYIFHAQYPFSQQQRILERYNSRNTCTQTQMQSETDNHVSLICNIFTFTALRGWLWNQSLYCTWSRWHRWESWQEVCTAPF